MPLIKMFRRGCETNSTLIMHDASWYVKSLCSITTHEIANPSHCCTWPTGSWKKVLPIIKHVVKIFYSFIRWFRTKNDIILTIIRCLVRRRKGTKKDKWQCSKTGIQRWMEHSHRAATAILQQKKSEKPLLTSWVFLFRWLGTQSSQ